MGIIKGDGKKAIGTDDSHEYLSSKGVEESYFYEGWRGQISSSCKGEEILLTQKCGIWKKGEVVKICLDLGELGSGKVSFFRDDRLMGIVKVKDPKMTFYAGITVWGDYEKTKDDYKLLFD